jgi:hypothetical protein
MKTYNYLIAVLLFIVFGCSESEQKQEKIPSKGGSVEQMNISILIDLSDRILVNKENDIELMTFISDCFKKHIEQKNLFFIHDQIKVFFYPAPQNNNINEIAGSLKFKLDPSDREQIKNTWENITATFSEKLTVLYNLAIGEGKTKGFYGSDTWRFFSDKVHDYCIESNPGYRNILIILTDGYLYSKETQTREKNKTTYLTAPLLEKEGLRRNPDWQKKYKEGNYGFITKRNDLNNLEVLVLEVNPSKVHRNDDEIIKRFWGDWFENMNVKTYKILTTDVPSNTEPMIKEFLNAK